MTAPAAAVAPSVPPPQDIPPLSDVEKTFRMGADARNMNLAQLRARTQLLHSKLDEFYRRLLATRPGSSTWSDTLSMCGILNAQLAALHQELRPLLKYYVMHPQAATLATAAPWWRENALPGMHSVRLEPSMEAEEAELAARQREADALHDALRSPAYALDTLQRTVDAHNAQIVAALEALQRGRGDVARAVEAAKAQSQTVAAARRAPTAEATALLLGAAQFGDGIRTGATQTAR